MVSSRSGVSSSDPTAMISAFIGEVSGQRQPSTSQSRVKSAPVVVRIGAARGQQRQADEAAAAEHEFGFAPSGVMRTMPRRPRIRCRDVEISVAIEGQSLRPAEAAKEHADSRPGD